MGKKQLSNPRTGKEIEPKLEAEEWYQNFIQDCEAILKETIYIARTEIIKGKWMLGERILKENDNFERKQIYGDKIVSRVTESLRALNIPISRREVWRCIQFTKQYPGLIQDNELSIEEFPEEGKNISWHKICNKYLPSPKKGKTLEGCKHSESEIEELSYLRCRKCGKNLKNFSRIPDKTIIIRKIEDYLKAKNFRQLTFEDNNTTLYSTFKNEKEWQNYLGNKYRTILELWEISKQLE